MPLRERESETLRLLKLVLLIGFTSVLVFASPVNCTEQTLANYMTMSGSCVIGRLEFSNFGYHPDSINGGTPPAANQIMVDPTNAGGNPGLDFLASWMAQGVAGGDTGITYEVTVLPGEPLLTSATLDLVFTVTHPVVALGVKETICMTGQGLDSCPLADQVVLDLNNVSGNPPASTSVTFAPTSQISVLKDVQIKGETFPASGIITEVSNHYPAAAVPEPMSSLLGVSGLLLIAAHLVRRRVTP